MDELAAVKHFRTSVPERDPVAKESARRMLEDAMRAPAPRRRPRRRARGALIAAATLLAGLLVVSSAFGWTGRLVDLIAGAPAPPRVKQAFAVRNDAEARRLLPIFRSSGAMQTIPEQAHGVIGIESSAGPVFIWAAPTRGGGLCWVLDVERMRLPDGHPNGGGGCNTNAELPGGPLFGGMRKTRVGDGYLRLVEGRVRPEVARVELRYADGATEELPIFEGFVLQEPRSDSEPTMLVAFDADGHELARRPIRDPEFLHHEMPKAAGPERVLFRFETVAGFPLTFAIAPAEGGNLCQITRYRGGGGRGCNPDPRASVAADELSVHPGLQNEAGDGKALVTLNGVVGVDVASLELRYEDGTAAGVPIVERFVLFEIPPAHHRDRRFTLIARDRAGAEIARSVVS